MGVCLKVLMLKKHIIAITYVCVFFSPDSSIYRFRDTFKKHISLKEEHDMLQKYNLLYYYLFYFITTISTLVME